MPLGFYNMCRFHVMLCLCNGEVIFKLSEIMFGLWPLSLYNIKSQLQFHFKTSIELWL